jgi:hypothetical protein
MPLLIIDITLTLLITLRHYAIIDDITPLFRHYAIIDDD